MIAAGRAVPLAAGVGGAAVMGASVVATALAYRGTQGEPYSPFSHWISELGEEGVSELAPVFNAGVVVGGICLGAVMASLAVARGGRLAGAYGLVGVAAGISGAAAGLFPMNNVGPHGVSASSFFNLTALGIGLASVDMAKRPDGLFGRRQAALGVVALGVIGWFLIAATSATWNEGLAALEPPEDRAAVSPLTSLEWASLLAIVAWVVVTSASWRGAR